MKMSQISDKYTLVDIPGMIKSPLLRAVYGTISYPLERLLGIQRLNLGYDRVKNRAQNEREFIDLVKKEMGVDFHLPPENEIEFLYKIKGPVVFVSNHPFGGIESFVIVQLLGLIRDDYRIISTFFVQRIRELQRVLFAVDPYEKPSSKKDNVTRLKKLIEYLRKDGMIHVFPAGEVSSYKIKSRKIEDRHWNEGFCRLIRRTGATVVPLYFHGRNSLFFQMIGFLSGYIRTVFLLREFAYPREKRIRYKLGNAISPQIIGEFPSDRELSIYLRKQTYLLSSYFVD